MYIVCKNQYAHKRHFVWLSTPVQVTDLMTDWHGNVLEVVPRQTWIRQLEIDVGLTADAAWDTTGDRDVWRAQRPIAGQAVQ